MTGFFAGGTFLEVTKEEDAGIKAAAERLGAAEIPNALKEARLLWSAVRPSSSAEPGIDRIKRFNELIVRRIAREPLSHLVGYRDFYDHRFLVTADVLDPRPDTEVLIQATLEKPFKRVLDLGTGSGCILLSLLALRETATGIGTDLSEAALAVAARNSAALELDHKAAFVQSDWFASVQGVFDLIVSNPPYIAADEMAGLQPEVRLHEPRMALTDDADGLTAYRMITAGVLDHLTLNGRLIVEIGPTQADAVSAMMENTGLSKIAVLKDIDGRDRVVIGYNA